MVHPDQSRELTQRLLQGEPAYYRGGWATIVVNLGLKTPFGRWASFQQRRRTEAQIIRDRNKHPLANIGLVCGKILGRTVIDLDGDKSKATFQASLSHLLPTTRQHQTPSGGYHLVNKYNAGFHTGANFLRKVDVGNDGGYSVAPPLVVDGIEYRVIDELLPAEIHHVPECFQPKAADPPPHCGCYQVRTNSDLKWCFQLIDVPISDAQASSSPSRTESLVFSLLTHPGRGPILST